MAKRVKKGVGMTERVVVQQDQTDFDDPSAFASAFFDALEANCIADNVRTENANRCRDILAQAGLELDNLESQRQLATYPEDSAQSLAAEWLRTFRHIEALRERAATGDAQIVSDLIGEAEHLGVIQERMWWRRGLDYSTGKPRESLALSGQAQVKAGMRGNEMRSASGFAAMHGEEAQALAHEIADRNPNLSWTAIRNQLAAKFNVSAETIKKSLRNPKKAG